MRKWEKRKILEIKASFVHYFNNPIFQFRYSKSYKSIILILFLFSLSACNTSKNLPKSKIVLHKNSIEIKDAEKDFKKDDIWTLIQQKPNKKILGIIPFKLWVYNLGNKGKETKFKNWLKNKVGEEPVYLDYALTNNTVRQ